MTQAMAETRRVGRFQPGVSGNPGGRPKKSATNDWLMQVAYDSNGKPIRDPKTQEELTRYQRQMATLETIALNPDHPACVKAIELFWAYGRGLPVKTPSTLDYAEHLRKIEAGRTDLALAILGERLKTMDGKQVGEFLRECAVNADVFIRAAKQLEAERDGIGPVECVQDEPGDVPSQPEPLPPIEAQEPQQEQSSESATVEPNGWNDK